MTVSPTRLQAYQSLGPNARRLHKAYLEARREWEAARSRMLDLWFKAERRTPEEEVEYDALVPKVRRLSDAMREAQRVAAHCERAI